MAMKKRKRISFKDESFIQKILIIIAWISLICYPPFIVACLISGIKN